MVQTLEGVGRHDHWNVNKLLYVQSNEDDEHPCSAHHAKGNVLTCSWMMLTYKKSRLLAYTCQSKSTQK